MTLDDLEKVIKETKRFLDKAMEARRSIREDSMVSIVGSKETAAAKRASLDLSSALVDLRKPPGKR